VGRTGRGVAVGLMAGCLLWPGVASAAPRSPQDREERREDIQETIEIYMVAKLKRFLELTEVQERQVIPLVEEINSARREANRKRRLAMMRLRPMVEEGAESDEAAILRQVDELERLERDMRETESTVRQQMRTLLTPLQQARFIVFQERFRHEIQERLRRMDQEGMGGRRLPPDGPGRGPRAPR